MAKTWILDSETKGTGANVVPFEGPPGAPARPAGKLYVPPKLTPRPVPPPAPPPPRMFKVVEVVSGRVLADRADTRAAVHALEAVRSIVDVHVSVWQPERERWRMLGLDELRALWAFRS